MRILVDAKHQRFPSATLVRQRFLPPLAEARSPSFFSFPFQDQNGLLLAAKIPKETKRDIKFIRRDNFKGLEECGFIGLRHVEINLTNESKLKGTIYAA